LQGWREGLREGWGGSGRGSEEESGRGGEGARGWKEVTKI